MFGQNEVTKSMDYQGRYYVKEIFSTIQGEGPHAGRSATFIRLAGCNLRCHFCDTDFSLEGSARLTVVEILKQTVLNGHELVVITGGEPLLQDLTELVSTLLYTDHEVQIETAGTLAPPPIYDRRFTIVVSPKTGSIHPEIAQRAAAFKYLTKAGAFSEADGLPNWSTQDPTRAAKIYRPPVSFPKSQIYLQPLDETHVNPAYTKQNVDAAVSLCRKFGYRLSLQLHKILSLP